MKYGFIRTHQAEHGVAQLCRVLRVSRSGYYAWCDRAPSARMQADARLLLEIRRLHASHHQAYGAVKTWRALKAQGGGLRQAPCGPAKSSRRD